MNIKSKVCRKRKYKMNESTLPSLRCQAHWQNAQSNRLNQILPKSFPARPALTHRLNDIAANLKLQNFKRQNNGLKANTTYHNTVQSLPLDNDEKAITASGLTISARNCTVLGSFNRYRQPYKNTQIKIILLTF